jgi:hypothetical protein
MGKWSKFNPKFRELMVSILESYNNLYGAILAGEYELAQKMIDQGIGLREEDIQTLTGHGKSSDRVELQKEIRSLSADECLKSLKMLDALIPDGATICPAMGWFCEKLVGDAYHHYSGMYDAQVLAFLVSHGDMSKVKHQSILYHLVDENLIDSLSVLVEAGWIKTPRARDELIEYAQTQERTEALAWLLDYKNKTADFAAEAQKARKKAERELNESPDSVSALQKIWNYQAKDDGTIRITGYKGKDTNVTVPAVIGKKTVTEVGKMAFSPKKKDAYQENRKNVVSVILPETVKVIGKNAFAECSNLESVDIPDGVTSIGDNAFDDCGSLKSIVLPKSITSVGNYMFSYCENLESVGIPDGVISIGKYAFSNCFSLESVVIPNGVTSIGDYAFVECGSLKSVVIPDGTACIGTGIFEDCYDLKSISVPAGMDVSDWGVDASTEVIYRGTQV